MSRDLISAFLNIFPVVSWVQQQLTFKSLNFENSKTSKWSVHKMHPFIWIVSMDSESLNLIFSSSFEITGAFFV